MIHQRLVVFYGLSLLLSACVAMPSAPGQGGKVVAEAMADVLERVQPVVELGDKRIKNPLSEAISASARRARQPVSLELQQVPLHLALRALSEQAGLDIVLEQGLKGSISLKLEHLPWLEAVRLAASSLGWQAHFSESMGLVRVLAAGCQAAGCRHQQLRLLEHREASEMIIPLQQLLHPAGSGGKLLIAPDAVANGILLSGSEEEVARALKLIDEMDRRRELVLIEVWIVELGDTSERQLGMELGLSRGDLSGGLSGGEHDNLLQDPVTAANAAVIARNTDEGIALRLAALARQGYTRILSHPRIYVMEGEQAEIFQGDEVPYTVRTNEGGSHTEFRQAGLGLKVRPRLQKSGMLSLELEINKDTVDRSRENPPISRRAIRTRLLITPGEAAIIGGIRSDGEAGVSKGLPGLGAIGGSGERGRDSAQLLVVLSARVAGRREGAE